MKKMNMITGIALAGAAFFMAAGCTTDPATGTAELFGVIPVSESALDATEAAAQAASGSGGILGIVGTAACAVLAYWRRRKELEAKGEAEASATAAAKAKLAAESVIDGVDGILSKLRETREKGEEWIPTREELLSILKSAQNAAGTRDDVDAILAMKKGIG